MEPYAMLQVFLLLQLQSTMVANIIPGKFSQFQQNPWQLLVKPQLKITDVE